MKVAIITEGFQGTGYGHLTRCLSLNQAFEERNIIPLYITNCDENGKKYIGNVNLIELDWLNNTASLFEMIKDFDIAIIDSYLAPLEIYEQIQKLVKKPVYIDDYIRLDYPPGIIINGTIGGENLPYKKDNKHQYYLGIDYMPLRKEFWDIEIPQKGIKEIKNVLITFGGQDFRELTFPILDFLLEKHPLLNYHVVKGNIKNNNTTNNNYSNKVNFYSSLNAKEMLDLMLDCDLAVSSAGQTTYELARLGLPTTAIGIADNQKYNLSGWVEKGFIKQENWYYEENLLEKIKKQLHSIIATDTTIIKSFCDGQGARRIINKIIDENTILN